ncbi:MAG: YwiC-like family protein [Chloroflexales bacterium]|nr:YwiC-like family protein [Chloroflexales bacterium]
MPAVTAPTHVRLRPIALPVEHGGWAFLFVPLLLGLWVTPSLAGAWLSLAALGAFLTRHPLKIALADHRRGKHYPRTVWAWRFTGCYIALALLGIGMALITAQYAFWLPLLLAVPGILVQFAYDARGQSRALLAELAGTLALGSLASALALAAAWPLFLALVLWLLLAAWSGAAILYVRARLRLERGGTAAKAPALVAHLLGVALTSGLIGAGLAPWPTLIAFVALAVRAFLGLSPYRRPVPAKIVGLQETGFSLLVVVSIALGYILA